MLVKLNVAYRVEPNNGPEDFAASWRAAAAAVGPQPKNNFIFELTRPSGQGTLGLPGPGPG